MKRILFTATAILSAFICPDAPAAAARSYGPPKEYLEIDNVSCGAVEKSDGGDLRAAVKVGPLGVKDPVNGKKQPIFPPPIAPLVITIGFPLPQPIVDWIRDMCANQTDRKTVQLVETDYAGAVQFGTIWYDTQLVEVDFPAFDASDQSPALLTLTFLPGSSRPVAAGTTIDTTAYDALGRTAVNVQCCDFTLAIDGLDTARVNRIEALVIKRPPTSSGIHSDVGSGLPSQATTDFSNLVVSVGKSGAATWQAWFDDFIGKANFSDANEKSGTLAITDSARSREIFTLQFSNLGITRLSPPAYVAGTDQIARDQAELYCETMTVPTAGAQSGTSSTGSSTATGGTATTPASMTAPPPTAGKASLGTTPVAPGAASAGASPSTTAGGAGTPQLSIPAPGAAAVAPPASTVAGSTPTLTSLPPSPAAAPSGTPIPSSASPAIFTSAPTAPGSPAPAPAAPGATTSPTITVPGMGAPTAAPAALASVAPGAAPPRPLTGALATTAPALPTAAADQTPAALANFPVLSGATRTWFSSSRGKSTWQERATYTAAVAPNSALASYAPQLAAAGWDETGRSETGDAAAGTHQFTLDYRNGQTTAHVILAQNQKQGTNLDVRLTSLFPGSSAPALGTGSTAAPATGATAAASDRGVRDPADFPRLPGSIRTSFTATSQKTSSQEIATYTARCSPAAADAFYTQSLPGAGWDEITRYETVDDQSKSDQISTTWQNASRSATMALNGSTAGSADIRVTVTTQVSGTP